MITSLVENFPGFREGVLGPSLMEEMRSQAQRFGAEILQGNVVSVDLSSRPFVVRTDESDYRADTLIIATGASAKWIGLPSEKQLVGRGVSSCATCDGAFFKNRPIVVVGGGDTAMEEALFLTRFASEITVIHRRDKLRASRIMQDKALAHPKIRFVWNSIVEDVTDVAKGEVTGRRRAESGDRRARDDRSRRRIRRHRPLAEHRPVQGPARDGRERVPGDALGDAHERAGRVRCG